jgi:hypothetical protein
MLPTNVTTMVELLFKFTHVSDDRTPENTLYMGWEKVAILGCFEETAGLLWVIA